MEHIKNYFDIFTWNARVSPAIIAILPFFSYLVSKDIFTYLFVDYTIKSYIIIAILIMPILYFLSQCTRDMGKNYEKNFINKNDIPLSAIILRFSDKTIDTLSKQRYHDKLNKAYNLSLPLDPSQEKSEDDKKYIAASRILRIHANFNRKKYFLIYENLKQYNFYRNLYGIKKISRRFYYILLIIDFFITKDDVINYFKGNYSFFIILTYIIFISCVKESDVKERAKNYAISLIESCELIKDAHNQ